MNTTTETNSHCRNCECPDCKDYFAAKDRHDERENKFISWSWNLSPAEVAQEIRELQDCSYAWDDEDEVFEHMTEFFDGRTTYAVQDILDTLL